MPLLVYERLFIMFQCGGDFYTKIFHTSIEIFLLLEVVF